MILKAVWASYDQENEECGLASSCKLAAMTEKLGIYRSQNWDVPLSGLWHLLEMENLCYTACVLGQGKFVPCQLYDLNIARQFEKTCISRHSVSNRIVEVDF